ncbi:MAG: glycosyltransferase [Ignavibacteriales bacterium]|nr:glycosyltransferase [Ignavibacteriales bacterium]
MNRQLKILHIAPQNFAGVPYDFMRMHNKLGDFSRLITLHKNPVTFPEDICLDLPLPGSLLAKKWRKKKVALRKKQNLASAPYFSPKNIFEKIYFRFSDISKSKTVDELLKKYSLDNFEIIHYDGGIDFFRNSKQALRWKSEGKKIVCCYYGSDLRLRGLIRDMHKISDLNITSEFDHLSLLQNIKYLFYPYDTSELPLKVNREDKKVRIVHSPTNRAYKGTELILRVIERVKKNREIDFVLLENVPRDIVLREKSLSDISIDQVGGSMGGTGYGKAGLETLAMGLPTITNMTDDYLNWLPENPFVVVNDEETLFEKLIELIDDYNLRNFIGEKGKLWVEKYHGFDSVNSRLIGYYKEAGIV